MGPPQYRFAHYRLHCVQGLARGGERIAITPKALAVLLVLVEHAGQLVTKEEIFRRVWGRIAVSDAALTSCIQELRRALGDDAHAPRYIETHHRRGFRFVARLRAELRDRDSQPESTNVGRLPAHVVGRDAPLRQLAETLQRARSGERQIVFVTGEAGIGKTTLLELLLSQIADPGALKTCRTACVERHGVAEAYQPLLDSVQRLCRGIDSKQSIATLRRCAPSWLAQLPMLQTAAERSALQRLTTGGTSERMLRELTDALEVLAAAAPIVLCLEDLHWSDVATLDWIASFAHRSERAAVLLLGTLRTGETAGAALSAHTLLDSLRLRGLCTEIALPRLDRAAVAQYVHRCFAPSAHAGEGDAVARLADLVHSHSDGNPLFIVNILDDLLERGVLASAPGGWTLARRVDANSLGVPTDIRRAIEQQVGRLGPFEQSLLEIASIHPASCTAAAVATAAGESAAEVEKVLVALARRDAFLRELPATEWPDGTASASFEFLHALYREVLSGRLSAARRAQLHLKVGTRLESAYGVRAPQIAAELAVHFEQARELPRAITYLQHAAETDTGRTAHASAQRHFRHALALLQNLPPSAERDKQEAALRIGLGGVLTQLHGWGAREVQAEYELARDLSTAGGASELAFTATWNLWVTSISRGELLAAAELATRVFESACCSADESLLLQGHHARWTTAFALGNLDEVETHTAAGTQLYRVDRSVAQLRDYGSHDAGVCARTFRARAAALCGRTRMALDIAEESVVLARELAHPFTLTMALVHASAVHLELGDTARALRRASEAATIASEQGFSLILSWSSCFQGAALVAAGRNEEGLSCLDKGLTQIRSTGTRLMQPHMLALLATAQIKCLRLDEAQRSLDEALTLVERDGERTYLAELRRLQGELLLAQPGDEDLQRRAARDLREAFDIAHESGSHLLALRAAQSLSRLSPAQLPRAAEALLTARNCP